MGRCEAASRHIMIAFALASLAAAPIQQSSLDGFNKSSHIRELSPSQGCIDCCVGHDCTAGFNGLSGICCGSAPAYGCCPMGATCVKCNSHWMCSNSEMRRSAWFERDADCSCGVRRHDS